MPAFINLITHLRSLLLIVCIAVACKGKQQQEEKHKEEVLLQSYDYKPGREVAYVAQKDDHYRDQLFDEDISGGYRICYTIDDTFKYVYLKRGDSIVKRLNALSRNVGNFMYMGYLFADFEQYFLLGHDNGIGAPQTIELFEKSNGRNIWGREMIAIFDNDDPTDTSNITIIVYVDPPAKQLVLLNFSNMNSERFDLPGEMFREDQYYNFSHLKADSITPKTLTISYYLDKQNIVKTYPRRMEL